MQKFVRTARPETGDRRHERKVCYDDTAVTAATNAWTVTFPQKTCGVALIEISR